MSNTLHAKQLTGFMVFKWNQLSSSCGLLDLESAGVKAELAHKLHHFYFQHQEMTSGSVDVVFSCFKRKLRFGPQI